MLWDLAFHKKVASFNWISAIALDGRSSVGQLPVIGSILKSSMFGKCCDIANVYICPCMLKGVRYSKSHFE